MKGQGRQEREWPTNGELLSSVTMVGDSHLIPNGDPGRLGSMHPRVKHVPKG